MEKWDFLEPWRVVLVRDRTTTEFAGESSFITRIRATLAANSDIAESVQVSISFAEKYPSSKKTICLKLPIDETNRREASRLRQLREAMELFTLLSVVNNRAFTELTASATEPQPAKTGEHRIQLPSWSLQLVGTLSPNAVSAVQSQVTWGALLGFPEDPWGYSPEFREAVARLEAMGLDESVKKCVSKLSIRWVSKLQAADVRGDQMLVTFDDPCSPFRGQFRELFDAIVPPIAHVCATHGCNSLVTCTESEPPQLKTEQCQFVSATVWDWAHSAVPEVTTALTRTSITWLMLSLERGWMNSRQAVMNFGFLLNSLVCDHSAVSGGDNRIVSDTIQYDRLDLRCNTGSDWLCAATCSAVAESSVEMHLGMTESTHWLWLIYALCCGGSDVRVWTVDISRCKLTKSDIVAIATVLQTNYPQPILEPEGKGHPQYGFVDIQEGAELQLCGVYDYRENGFVVSKACRCRALYTTADGEWVNVVVPGYGTGKAKIGGGTRFIPDSVTPQLREKRLSGALELNDVRLETRAPDYGIDIYHDHLHSINNVIASLLSTNK